VTTFDDPILHELFVRWPAWQTLAGYLTVHGTHPGDADPRAVFDRAAECESERLVALLYGHGHGDSLVEAARILGDLLFDAFAGRRPRFGVEMGIGPETLAPGGRRTIHTALGPTKIIPECKARAVCTYSLNCWEAGHCLHPAAAPTPDHARPLSPLAAAPTEAPPAAPASSGRRASTSETAAP
jgi:hypothetical protein